MIASEAAAEAAAAEEAAEAAEATAETAVKAVKVVFFSLCNDNLCSSRFFMPWMMMQCDDATRCHANRTLMTHNITKGNVS